MSVVDSARMQLGLLLEVAKAVSRVMIHGPGGEVSHHRSGKIIRWCRITILVIAAAVAAQSVLLVAGAWRNDRIIESNMGVAAATVLNAGPRRSTIEFVTPDRVTYRPELGVLYPSELENGMRIYVEYDRDDPNLVRVQDRDARLALIPAGSILVLDWVIAGALLIGLAVLEKSLDRRRELAEL
ncbi:DUF3592 domain-containing protein [Mycolicibacterium brumae]|uniref:DUF3592 domain-containing protein n=1 Tax=Mycolicibacterium brumae TaxID=85968 RepID=UPI000A6188AE|nr:hypothetical protein MBRU_04980 [Mycolicibacterium brumae DSM 44177]